MTDTGLFYHEYVPITVRVAQALGLTASAYLCGKSLLFIRHIKMMKFISSLSCVLMMSRFNLEDSLCLLLIRIVVKI